jgi:hypothetical protein
MKKLAFALAVSALALGACKKEEGTVTDVKTTQETTTKPAEPAKPEEKTTTTTTTTTTTDADKIGIAECDTFVAAYRACVEKMPEAARGPAGDGLKQMVDAWKQAAAQGDAAKDALKTGCKSALDSTKQSMAAACPDVKWE